MSSFSLLPNSNIPITFKDPSKSGGSGESKSNMAKNLDERSPLLQHNDVENGDSGDDGVDAPLANCKAIVKIIVDFTEKDGDNPRNWSKMRKLLNVAVIAMMAILSPLASSMFTPGISQIAKDLDTPEATVVGATTGFVVALGIGPLLLAPLSETFGRRKLYLVCFTVFALTQIPTALARNVIELNAWRTVSGFFGSVGIANGGGTIADMMVPSERAGVFGWYLLGPLLGPTLGPLFGGLIVQKLGWRWVFWILTIVCSVNTAAGWFFLRETYAPIILDTRRKTLEDQAFRTSSGKRFRIIDQDDRPLRRKIAGSMIRPLRILFTQPIVLTMATYQAIIFGTVYSLYTNFEAIYGGIYGFNTIQVGLVYLGPGLGFLIAVLFLVPRIDTIFNQLTERNHGESKPEFRLPLANIGAVSVPLSLFCIAWTVEYRVHVAVPIAASIFFGLGMVTILNTVQNYYIDSFSKYAASAIAAGAVFRSIVGGVLPLGATSLFEKLGYGWGISVFGFLALGLSPAPVLFYFYGQKLRELFAIDL